MVEKLLFSLKLVVVLSDGPLKAFLEAAQEGKFLNYFQLVFFGKKGGFFCMIKIIAGSVQKVENFIRSGTNVDANSDNGDWPAFIVAAKSGKIYFSLYFISLELIT